MEKFCSIWKHTCWDGVGDDLHYKIIGGSQKFTWLSSSKTSSQRRLLTVVLQGAAGVGKTTLAKKWMLDWAQDHLPGTFHSAFYLSCKELGRQGPCTFAELLAKKCPDAQEAGPQVLAQGQKILVVIDGFDELRVPLGSLIHDICGDWEKPKPKPMPVLLGSLLKRKLLPKATLLVTTRAEALGELRLLVDQPLFIEVEGFLEADRRGYFLKHFEQQDQALRAFEGMKGSLALFHMGAAPAVCWVVCTCLKGQLEKGEDRAPTCRTPTSLFLCFLRPVLPSGPPASAPQRPTHPHPPPQRPCPAPPHCAPGSEPPGRLGHLGADVPVRWRRPRAAGGQRVRPATFPGRHSPAGGRGLRGLPTPQRPAVPGSPVLPAGRRRARGRGRLGTGHRERARAAVQGGAAAQPQPDPRGLLPVRPNQPGEGPGAGGHLRLPRVPGRQAGAAESDAQQGLALLLQGGHPGADALPL